MATIKNTQSNGVAALSVSVGSTDVWKGDSYHEYGLIIDVMLGQLGTTILFKYVK